MNGNIFIDGRWQRYCSNCDELIHECVCETSIISDEKDSKLVVKLQRKIDKLRQKLKHISSEISDLNAKSKIKPLNKKQSYHLLKLHKVKKTYCNEIFELSSEILNIRYKNRNK